MHGTLDPGDDRRRIGRQDCLYALFEGLAQQGRSIRLYDADAWAQWSAGCAQVLAAVPDDLQRKSWALALTNAVSLVGCSKQDVFDTLIALTEGVRRCR